MTKSVLSFIAFIFIWSTSVNAGNIKLAKDLNLSTTIVKTIDGKTIKLGEIIGKKPVYLKFWATWCVPCREQMPHLQHSFEQHGNKIETIAINININDSQEAIKLTQQEFQLTVPIIIDKGAVLAQAFNLIATPYHVLINKDGKIIHTGHDATDELDKKLQLLANDLADNLNEVTLNNTKTAMQKLSIPDNKTTLIFFTSAWCDWYLEKSRPQMAKQCIDAQKQVNVFSAKYPGLNWQGVLTRLWTGEKELNEYTEKYSVPFEMIVDHTNKYFFDFKVDSYPTLIAVKNGKEIFRTSIFNDTAKLQTQLKSLVTINIE